VAALAAVNAAGSAVVDDGPWFWAAPYEQNGEFGGHGFPATVPARALEPRTKGAPRQNTTLVVVATDAVLTKAQARHLAVMAQDGLARAIHPVHTPLDGDIVFAAATGKHALDQPPFGLTALGSAAAQVVARAIARGIYEAAALPLAGTVPGYRERFP
jgi:D-aminopeptidase